MHWRLQQDKMIDITPKLFYVPYTFQVDGETKNDYKHVTAVNKHQAIGSTLDQVRDSTGKRLDIIILEDQIKLLESFKDLESRKTYQVILQETPTNK